MPSSFSVADVFRLSSNLCSIVGGSRQSCSRVEEVYAKGEWLFELSAPFFEASLGDRSGSLPGMDSLCEGKDFGFISLALFFESEESLESE